MVKCPNCGANPLPGAERCAYCDHPIPKPPPQAASPAQVVNPTPPKFKGPAPQQPYGAPPFSGSGPAPLSQGMVAFRPPPPPPEPMPNFILWIVLGLGQFLLCQVSIPGLIGAIMTFTAKSEWERGSYDVSLSKIRTAKMLVIVNFVLVAIVFILYILLMIVGIVSSA